MTQRARGKKIRQQILRDVKYHPNDIAHHISVIFEISRQAVYKHLKAMVDDGFLLSSGSTRKKVYTLGPRRERTHVFELDANTSEHAIYSREFEWVIDGVPRNIEDIVFYGFTEMVNNVIDHSQGNACEISVRRSLKNIYIVITDNGEGIFRRITRLKELSDEKQAILELHKGKLTTDPDNHSGQGIFFTSKMFDEFQIISHGLFFNHDHQREFDILTDNDLFANDQGTTVTMTIALDSTRNDKAIFDQYSGSEDDDYAFDKTIIPVKMARINKENLVSRSQAKRLLTRIENFKYVFFDFEGVETIGQAFADEIFRVYRRRHPEIIIHSQNESKDVLSMIWRAESEGF